LNLVEWCVHSTRFNKTPMTWSGWWSDAGDRAELYHGHVVIRRAEATDLAKVERVARTTWPVAYGGIIPDEVQRRLLDSWYAPQSLDRALAAQGSSLFVAESDGDVVGFAEFVRRSPESAELTRIYVLPASQRGGIGTGLLDAGLAQCAAEGLTRLTVSVERDNRLGRRFYEKSGFSEPREHSQQLQGYVLDLVEYRCPIPAARAR